MKHHHRTCSGASSLLKNRRRRRRERENSRKKENVFTARFLNQIHQLFFPYTELKHTYSSIFSRMLIFQTPTPADKN
jgi:hypothetical protein